MSARSKSVVHSVLGPRVRSLDLGAHEPQAVRCVYLARRERDVDMAWQAAPTIRVVIVVVHSQKPDNGRLQYPLAGRPGPQMRCQPVVQQINEGRNGGNDK